MPIYDDYRSLFANGERNWHDGDDEIRYDFVTSAPPSYYNSGFGWNIGGFSFSGFDDVAMDARERAMMERSVAAWNDVANINLVRGGGVEADIVIGSADFGNGLFGFAYYPNPFALGNYGSVAGDIWLNDTFSLQYIPDVGPAFGHTSWYTYLHELGHALGLSHPNDLPNDPDTNAKYTVMSYIGHPSQAYESTQGEAFPLTPMVWDIHAVQALYGVNTDTRADSTVYLGSGTGFDLGAERAFQYGDTDMLVRGEDGRDRDVILTIWDAGGEDLLDASPFDENAHIDLRGGTYSSIAGVTDNVAVAAAVRGDSGIINLVENAWGGSGDDTIGGNAGTNVLRGNGGNDVLRGFADGDVLRGGAGRDRLYGHNGSDTLYGGNKDDVLEAGNGHDSLMGGNGNDLLRGNAGRDSLVGGNGSDLLRGNAGRDSLMGGRGNDTLIGGSGHDTLNGGNGNDTLNGGFGADVFVFATGADRIIDFNPSNGDRIDMSDAAAIDDFADLNANHLENTDAGLLITNGATNSLLLLNVEASALSDDHFVF